MPNTFRSIAFRSNRSLRILSLTLLAGALASCTSQETVKSLAPGPDSSNQLPGIIVTGHSRSYHPSEVSSKTLRIYATPTAVLPRTPAATPAPPPPSPPPPKKKKPVAKPSPRLPLQKDIFFAFNSSRVSYANRAVLIAYAKLLKKNPRFSIVLTGHTDPKGTSRYNRSLGLKRALAAKRVLLLHGIKTHRIRVYSEGEKPVSSLPRCHKPSCYARDRAVRLRVVKKGIPSGTSKSHKPKKKKG